MTDMSAAGGRTVNAARPGLIDRHDLVAALDRAAGKQVTIISAPAGSGKTSLLHAWADRPGQDRLIAFMSVRPAPARRAAVLARPARRGPRRDRRCRAPARRARIQRPAMVDKVRSELAAPGRLQKRRQARMASRRP